MNISECTILFHILQTQTFFLNFFHKIFFQLFHSIPFLLSNHNLCVSGVANSQILFWKYRILHCNNWNEVYNIFEIYLARNQDTGYLIEPEQRQRNLVSCSRIEQNERSFPRSFKCVCDREKGRALLKHDLFLKYIYTTETVVSVIKKHSSTNREALTNIDIIQSSLTNI